LYYVSDNLLGQALANSVANKEDLLALPHTIRAMSDDSREPQIPITAIPTSLSGAEYIPFAGVTDDTENTKYQFTGKCKGPAMTILSGELALSTNLRNRLASGVQAVDHCIEAICTLRKPEKTWEEGRSGAMEGFRYLVPSLPRTKADPDDIEGWRQSLMGVEWSPVPLKCRMFKGASHAIGHFLGPSKLKSSFMCRVLCL
jgi:alcohol dehydrogenase class IV